MPKIVLFNKPYGTLCQFSGDEKNLSNYIDLKNIYPAGRLDKDSEGLVVLTDDGQLQQKLSHPKYNKQKTYFAQLDGQISTDAINQLKQGIVLKDGLTKPAYVEAVGQPDWLWQRNPPIRERKSIPTSWIKLTISEGKNRQVRRMGAKVGFPVLRLIRYSLHTWDIKSLSLGGFEQLKHPL